MRDETTGVIINGSYNNFRVYAAWNGMHPEINFIYVTAYI